MVSNFESIVPNLPSIIPSPLHNRRIMLLYKEPLDSSQAGFRKTGNLGSVSVDGERGTKPHQLVRFGGKRATSTKATEARATEAGGAHRSDT